MKTSPRIRTLLLGAVVFALPAYAASTTPAAGKPGVRKTTATRANAPALYATPVPPPAEAAPPPSPWKLVYFGEYFGPRLSNIDLAKTQGPEDANPDYGMIDHSVKIGYAVAKNVVIGTQIRGRTPFDQSKDFSWKDWRLYTSWAHMIETKDLDMQGVLDVEFPTSDKSRALQEVIAFNIKNNWELKTSIRNWYFTAQTLIRPVFYKDPIGAAKAGKTDVYLGIFPTIQVDLAPSWQLQFDGSFDASHSYEQNFFNLGSDDPDYVDIGPLWSMNAHFQLNPAFRFYTGNLSFKAATLYVNLTAVL